MCDIAKSLRTFLLCLLSLAALLPAVPGAADEQAFPSDALQPLKQEGKPYRTPRAGEGFTTDVFGQQVTVEPRDRRSVAAWYLSVGLYEPPPEDTRELPMADFLFWEHPDDSRLFRAEVSGLYNEIFWARPLPGGPLEGVITFENFTVPFQQAELLDGRRVESEELVWGYVKTGFGAGYRKPIAPGHQDNMFSADLMLEPGFIYFGKGRGTSPGFVVPQDSFTGSLHLQFRVDALERNLLELPHRGIAAGIDASFGYRTGWENWGMQGAVPADSGRNYASFTEYFLAAGGVPGIDSDRHRMVAAFYSGTGRHLDRFSAIRIGGGPDPLGEEYGSTSTAVLPGAAVREFFPEHYLLGTLEYRWEAAFFAYLGLDATAGWVDRLRQTPTGTMLKNDFFTTAGARVTSGFLFKTQLQIAYNYNFSVVREGKYGGNEIILSISGEF